MKKIVFDDNGRKQVGAVAKQGSTTWFSFGGEVWTHEAEVRGRRGKVSASAADPSTITAPMPGKIVKVVSEVGTAVKGGDVVIVMEAMKMEYTLKAAADGVVKSVNCLAGDQVALGAKLVLLELKT